MTGVKMEDLVGSYVYLGFNEQLVLTGFEPPGPTRLIFVKLTGVDTQGVFFEHNQFPLSNKKTNDVEFVTTQVFIPFNKIAHISSFPSIVSFDDYVPLGEPVTSE